MNLKTRIITLFAGICLGTTAQANSMQFSIYTLDGNVSTYKLDDNPKIDVKEDHLIIFNNSIEVSFDFSNLQKLVYNSEVTGIESIHSIEDQPVLLLEGNYIKISPLQKEAQISIYDTKGMQIETKCLDANQHHVISISDLTQGLYIITLNKTTYKIMKK